MSGTAFDRGDAAALVQLAAFAELDLTGLGLPNPWKVIKTFTSSPGGQGFVAKGPLPSTGQTVALLVVGISWPDFIEQSLSSQHTLSFPPAGLLASDFAMTDLGISNFYDSFRSSMWTQILFARQTVPDFQASMPLVVTGIGPGALFAQLAALDFLPGHTWNKQTSPATDMTAYAFSCAAFGNQPFADAFRQSVPAGYTVNLRTNTGITVDFYPTSPGPAQQYILAGEVHGADAKIPTPDDPWVERDSPYYAAQLSPSDSMLTFRRPGGRTARRAASARYVLGCQQSAAEADTPAAESYDPSLAYPMSQLSLAEYQRYQHPDLFAPPAPYTFGGDITGGGVQWGSLYWSADRVVAAFRGLETWQETVMTWGDNGVTQPAWLVAQGSILSTYSAIYDSIRADLRTKLAALNMNAKPLVLTGHDLGGALASIAAYDLTLNPQTGVAAPAGIYSFGAPPAGDFLFNRQYLATMGAISFQVVRPDDVIPKLDFLTVQPLPSIRQLPGGTSNPLNGSVFHALTTYSQLLDPFGGVTLKGNDDVSPEAIRHFEDAVAGYRLERNEVHRCLLDTAETGGRLRFSWSHDGSYTPPEHDAHGRASHLVNEVIVRPGHELILEAPHGQEVRLFATRLTLSPGSRVRLSTESRLNIGHLRVLAAAPDARETAPPRIDVVGAGGADGVAGAPGLNGANGGPNEPGAAGGHGGGGTDGTRGGDAPGATFQLGTIEGTLVVHVAGGQGGNGGDGGAGGNGGNGGAMSPGIVEFGGAGGAGGWGGPAGAGGDGSTVFITYRDLGPHASIFAETPAAAPGRPGRGGAGGRGGNGTPPGLNGSAGAAGTPAAPGRTGHVIVQQG